MARRVVYVEGIVPVTRGYPVAVVSQGLVFIGGLRGGRTNLDRKLKDLPEKFREDAVSEFSAADESDGEFAVDVWTTHENLELVLKAAGSNALQVLRMHIWLKDKRPFPVYERVRMAWQNVPAPSSCLGVSSLPGRFGRLSGIEALAVVPGENMLFPERSFVSTFDNQKFPSAAFYSQAVSCGPLVTLAGHIPIATNKPGKPVIKGFDDVDSEGRSLATGRSHTDSRQGPIMAQTYFTYRAIEETLCARNLTLRDIQHVAVMLEDIRDLSAFHRVHRQFFPGNDGPALIVTGFDEVGHRGTAIEIEPTAVSDTVMLPIQKIAWPIAEPLSGVAAVRMGPLCLFSGIAGYGKNGQVVGSSIDICDAVGRRVVDDLSRFESSRGFVAQAWAAWLLLLEISHAAGLSLADLVKLVIYIRYPADIWLFEEVREAFLPAASGLPVIDFVAIPAPGPTPRSLLQIEAISSVS